MTTDQARVGLVFAKEPPKQRVLTLSASNGTFKIPPRDPNYQVDATFEMAADVTLAVDSPAHAYAAAKTLSTASCIQMAETKTILNVPHYNWHWQLWYNLDRADECCPRARKIECTAHFDNSPNNPENPDPSKTVIWGQQSWDEMMVGFFNLVFDAMTPVRALFPEKKDHAISRRIDFRVRKFCPEAHCYQPQRAGPLPRSLRRRIDLRFAGMLECHGSLR